MLKRVLTSTISGLDAVPVQVEVEISKGKGCFTIIGLADNAVRESRDRVVTALKLACFRLPERILVNLAPAELKKEGAGFDLPIAIGILCASGQVTLPDPDTIILHGELGLGGELKPVRGVVALAVEAKQRGAKELIVPVENADEAALVSGITVRAAGTLLDVVHHLRGRPISAWIRSSPITQSTNELLVSDVWGQEFAKRALMITAAGGHNMLMVGPPGCGKSMLAERLASLLPPLSEAEILEVMRVQSIAGVCARSTLQGVRPFRAPHHTLSEAGLIGGGSNPRPGEISMAHHGVLFLDEFPEFRRGALEALRAPLEAGKVRITRAKASILMPARFQLVAAMNPCPCGRLGAKGQQCRCTRAAVYSYLRKLSQPILDRIDVQVELDKVPLNGIKEVPRAELLQREQVLRQSVLAARAIQFQRQGKSNALLHAQELHRAAPLTERARKLLESAVDRLDLSARGYSRLIRVARTIADFAAEEEIKPEVVAEALQLRSLERIEQYCAAA
jgi:magnesium chelatase family protein